MTKKYPPVLILKTPKGIRPAKKPIPETIHHEGPRTEVKPICLETPFNAIERAKEVLEGVGEERSGMYLIDGHRVTLGTFLRAANDLIERENKTLPAGEQKPLIGRNHERWGQ